MSSKLRDVEDVARELAAAARATEVPEQEYTIDATLDEEVIEALRLKDPKLIWAMTATLATMDIEEYAMNRAAIKNSMGALINVTLLDKAVTAKRSAKAPAITAKATGHHKDGDRRETVDENLGLVPSLAHAVMDRYRFARDAGGALYRYTEGVYSRGAEESIRTELRDKLEAWGKLNSWRSSTGDEVAQYIADSHIPCLWENPPMDEICVQNGIVNVLTGSLRPHSSDFLSSIQLPVRYDRLAKCPGWIHFLRSTLPEDVHPIVWQFLGLLLVPDMSFQKAMLFFGPGGNGKTVLIDAMLALLGRGNVSSKTLHQLEENRFAAADLVGKLANVSSDLPAQHLADSSMFKMIVGGDEIDAERKHQPAFKFRPFARMLFSANTFPRSGDATDGFFRKWIVIPFEKSFEGAARRNKRELDAELQSPVELSGALNMALQGLAALRRFGFHESQTVRDAGKAFRETTDPLSVWLESRTEKDGEARIQCNLLLFTYNDEVSKVNGQSFLTMHTLTKTLRDRGIERMRSGDWYYSGLRLKAVSE